MAPVSYADAADGGDDHGVSPKDKVDEFRANRATNGSLAQQNVGRTTSTKASPKASSGIAKLKRGDASNRDKENSKTDSTNGWQQSSRAKDDNDTSTGQEMKDGGHFKIEKGHGNSNGTSLMSTNVSSRYEATVALAENEKPTTRKDPTLQEDLVSGRRAGAGWQRSKIRWAPRNVPLQRRLQTLSVLAQTLSIGAFLAFFLFLCAIPILWPILVPYLLYCLFSTASTSGKLSMRSETFRRSKYWSLFASYFPARLHRSQELPPTRKYVFGYHPHGIISHGAFAAFATEALGFYQLFPGITNTLLTLDSNFRMPLYRDYLLAMGLASVSRESCDNILSKGGPNNEGMGRAVTIVVGGARESLDAEPHTLKLILKRRKGFIKLALRNGADLVPVLGFGENDLYEQVQPEDHPYVHKLQLAIKKLMGFTVPLFHARGVFNYDVGLLPYRRPLNIVVGKPIRVTQKQKPTDAEIDELHGQYIDELLRLWEEWKDEFAQDRREEIEITE